jgi:tetratricopeptide (TPR) repeat protein
MFFRSGDFDKSKIDFEQTVKYDENHFEAFKSLGDLALKDGFINVAIENYSKAIALKPEYTQAYYKRGLSYKKNNLHQEAVQDFSKVIELSPSSQYIYYTYYLRAVSKDSLSDFSGAESDYSTVISFNNTFSNAFLKRAEVRMNQNRLSDACSDFKRVQEMGQVLDLNQLERACKSI